MIFERKSMSLTMGCTLIANHASVTALAAIVAHDVVVIVVVATLRVEITKTVDILARSLMATALTLRIA